jgi:Zn-dependent protease
MLRALRSILRWIFAIEAVGLIANTIYGSRQHLVPRSQALGGYAFSAAAVALAFLFAAAFWTTRQPRRDRRTARSYTAVAACLANAGLALELLRYASETGFQLNAFNLLVLGASAVGVFVFWSPDASPAPAAPPKLPRIPGDCTRPWFDHTYTILFILVILVAWHLWDGWAVARGLPHPSLPAQLLFITLAEVVTAIIHESGHAFAALTLRMKLLSFAIGPFQWSRYDGHWTLRFRISGLAAVAGGVNVVPRSGDLTPAQDAWVAAAGPLANLCSAPLLFVLALHIAGSRVESAWLFFAFMATFSLAIAFFNLLPLRATGGSYSDGARLLQLITSSPAADLHRTERRLQSTLVTSLRPRGLDPATLRHAASFFPGTAAAIRYHLCAADSLEDAGRIPDAAQEIAAGEAIYNAASADDGAHPIDLPAPLHLSFVLFHALHNRDAAAARLWWDRMSAKKPDRRSLHYWLAASALACIEGRTAESDEANAAWIKAASAARTLPPYGACELDRERLDLLRALLDEASTHSRASTATPPVIGDSPSTQNHSAVGL